MQVDALFPARQAAHAWQDRKDSTTWSPGDTEVTPGPTCSTTPVPSWPKTLGNISAGRNERIVMSVWHSPVAKIRTSTSPSRGSSSSTSTSSNSRPGPATTATVVCMTAP